MSSLSVILCAYNEQVKLGEQLRELCHQLVEGDELVLLDDGSTDETPQVIQQSMFLPWRGAVVSLRNERPSGINPAYNQATRSATREWLYFTSANDSIVPGAFAAFRYAVDQMPTVKVVTGLQEPPLPVSWSDRLMYLSPESVREAWTGIIQIVGSTTFMRREIRPELDDELAWNADWYVCNALALRYGLLWVPTVIARIGPTGYDSRGEDAEQLKPVREAILRKALADEFLGPIFQSKPLVMRWLETGEH